MTQEQLEQSVKSYRPNHKVLDGMKRIKVLATVGPSASGKTTLMNALEKLSSAIGIILDETTRALRPGEQDGVDFIFRNRRAVINDMTNGELVQVAVGPNGDLYCTRLSSYPKGTGVIALVPAAVQAFRRLPIASFEAAFIVPASFDLWQSWFEKTAKANNWTKQQIAGRLTEAKQSYQFALADKDIHFVLNDQIGKAARRLAQLAIGQAPADEAKAKQIAEANFQKL